MSWVIILIDIVDVRVVIGTPLIVLLLVVERIISHIVLTLKVFSAVTVALLKRDSMTMLLFLFHCSQRSWASLT